MFRILFGATMTFGVLRFIALGWVDRFFVEPRFHFTYFGFDWVRPWPAWGMHLHFWLLALLALMVTLGLFYRVAICAFFIAFTYVELIDVTYYLNHYYLVSLLSLLLCALPANAMWSLDARFRPRVRRDTVPALAVWILRIQVGVVYFYAGLAKLGSDWLLDAQPLNIWLTSRQDFPVAGPLFGEPLFAYGMSWAGFLFDTTIVLWLSLARTRLPAYFILLGFHAATGALFPIGMFPVIMTMAALVFFPPDWPRRFWGFLIRSRRSSGAVQAPARVEGLAGARLPNRRAIVAACVYAGVQVLFPLRNFLYGGDVLWHEQGMRWSWKVMVREKNGAVTFLVRLPDQDRILHINPRRYLSALQVREMSSQPDLILQLAHHIVGEYRQRGYRDVEVRVDAVASLNGRRAERLIDMDVDLAKVRDGLHRAPWILPAPETSPPLLASRASDSMALVYQSASP